MFTVKWIASNGAEMIYAAKDISFTPPQLDPKAGCDSKGPRATVSFYLADGSETHCSIDNGRVYVMNAFGKTVADYILQTEEFPHGLAPRQAA